MTIADYKLHGFDISHYQPAAPDFRSGGRVFGFCKASESRGVVDANLERNRAQAAAQQLACFGLYHFARPGKNAAADEAEHFLNVVGAPRPGEFAVLDYEVDPWSEQWAATWIHAVQAAGWRVVFYTYRAMLAPHPHAQIRATGADLWIAGYSAKEPVTDWPWTFWQHTNGTNAPDANSPPWDCSVYRNNDLDELAAFSGGNQGDDDMTTDEVKRLFAELADIKGQVTDLHKVAEQHYDEITVAGVQDLQKTIKEALAHPGTGGGVGQLTDADIDRMLDEFGKRQAEAVKALVTK